jgi:hypothetical protein
MGCVRLFRRITEPAPSRLVNGTLADLPGSRAELLAENSLLRQQLAVLQRQVKTLRLTWKDRLSWRWKSRRGNPARRLDAETVELIQYLERENSL